MLEKDPEEHNYSPTYQTPSPPSLPPLPPSSLDSHESTVAMLLKNLDAANEDVRTLKARVEDLEGQKKEVVKEMEQLKMEKKVDVRGHWDGQVVYEDVDNKSLEDNATSEKDETIRNLANDINEAKSKIRGLENELGKFSDEGITVENFQTLTQERNDLRTTCEQAQKDLDYKERLRLGGIQKLADLKQELKELKLQIANPSIDESEGNDENNGREKEESDKSIGEEGVSIS